MTSSRDVLAWLEKRGTKKQIAELDRYGIVARRPFGVSVGDLKKYAKSIGRDHELALALWAADRYEARMLAAFVDEPERVTLKQMNAWAGDFDSWSIVDTVCFSLFDRSPHAWSRVPVWAKARPEYKKRAAFAMLWSLSVHDKSASDDAFLEGLEVIEQCAGDGRDFVRKGVDMALRAIGKRNRALNRAAIETAEALTQREESAAQWIGGHSLRELSSAKVRARL